MSSERRTPDEWLQTEPFRDIIVLDPDGWDRKNFAADWARPLTEREFAEKVAMSTVVPMSAGWGWQ